VPAPGVLPRLVIAGTAGDCGKTLVALALLSRARSRGLAAVPFKKGPDYIDAAWLAWAAGRTARNLDTYLMGFPRVVSSFAANALADGLNLVEGNRGLLDGVDARGTHSTAELAKALRAPVVLVVNAAKVTRTAAAWVRGCQALDPDLRIAGVVLNRVNGARHERVLRQAIESACGVPVLAALPRWRSDGPLPERHLGLVTPEEHGALAEVDRGLAEWAGERLDLDAFLAIARHAPPLLFESPPQAAIPSGRELKIGYLRDSAFTFYYAENLEAIERAGAELVPISALTASELPSGLSALYAGGGFPETHAARLSANRPLLESIRAAARRGLPVYAECGGLMLLARGIRWNGARHAMAGVLPLDVEVCPTPQGHGYTELEVDSPNPFFEPGTELKGHEFHHSRVLPEAEALPTACAVRRGAGCLPGRDGIIAGNVWAGYTHLHALATPLWAAGLIAAARRFSAVSQHKSPD
jgi:cobyrinic acid a,c-diamide synthase